MSLRKCVATAALHLPAVTGKLYLRRELRASLGHLAVEEMRWIDGPVSRRLPE